MPFYDEKDPAKQREKLMREVAYLKKLFEAASTRPS